MGNKNLELWSKFAPCPANALTEIKAGKLKGKSDIQPVWRLKTLTEHFGQVGFGWYTEIVKTWVEIADNESTAWVILNLYVKDSETGEWSRPIQGVGGSKQNGKGQGDGINDEAFKMAETDAISVACKKLGMAADVYWNADRTKYTLNEQQTPSAAQQKPQTVNLSKEQLIERYGVDNAWFDNWLNFLRPMTLEDVGQVLADQDMVRELQVYLYKTIRLEKNNSK